MKLHTNLNNTSALKVLIAAGCTDKHLDIVIEEGASTDFYPRRLPILELNSEEFLFSTNAASYYLCPPPKNVDDDVNRWLDWEAASLQPSLVNCVNSKLEVTEPLPSLLSVLDTHLKSNKFIVKEELSVADVVIWSTLYPVLADKKLNKTLSFNRNNLAGWFNRLEEITVFKNAVSKLNPAGGFVSLQSISGVSFYPTNMGDSLKQSGASLQNEALTKDTPVTKEELKAAEDAWTKGSRPSPKPAVVPVLPKAGEKNVLITSALPYVNNVPHLGNIIGCVLSADVFARYCRLRNWNTLYVSGTDEYGTATETKALEEGLTPKQICDKYYAIHNSIYSWFNIQFDIFGRTTNPEQTEIVQEMFLMCHKNGYTTTSAVEQLLCKKCDRYLADRFVEGTCPDCGYEDARGDQCDGCGHLINATELINPRCKICSNKPIIKESQQLFLNLPKLEPRLKEWSAEVCKGWSYNAMVITNAWLKQGLNPRCITRDLKWGISVPLAGFEKKVFYVWFDAPIGYISMTKAYTEKWKQWWQPSEKAPVTCYQFMAKDNVPFHSIMFPATLIACGGNYLLVKHLMASDYLNYEDGKFSKSRGVGVFGNDAQETGIPSDIFRFYLLYLRPENSDTSFSWLDLATKNNSELLNNLGNFINRALMFTEKNYNSKVPNMTLTVEDYTLLALVTREVQGYIQALEMSKLRDGIRYILNISRHGNGYMQSSEPWVLFKQTDQDKIRAGTVIGVCCNIACLLGILLKPYMPSASETIGEQLNAPADVWVLTENVHQLLKPGHCIGKPSPLFAKIELSTVEELKKRFSGRQKSTSPPAATSKMTAAFPDSVDKMEAAIATQADLVRSLKASSDKSVWQPQVTVLLDMKKQLAAMKGEPAKASKQKGKGDKGTTS